MAVDSLAQAYLQQMQQQVLAANADAALAALERIDAEMARDTPDLAHARENFSELVKHWKATETLYIAGATDEYLIDLPRLIDHFHQGHESIDETLAKVLKSQKEVKRAMFKTSSKGINALEFLLFAAELNQLRNRQAARVAVQHLSRSIGEIAVFYRNDRRFLQDPKQSLQLMVNAMVDASYRLANWRIGEPAGLVAKFRDKPDARRLEYYRSGLSLAAILAILNTHARVFELGVESGYFGPSGLNRGLSEIEFVRGQIAAARAAAEAVIRQSPLDVESAQFRALFERAEALHKAYYFLLIDALGLEAKIIDADGD